MFTRFFANAYVAKRVNILPRFSFEHPIFDMYFNLSGLELVQVPNVSFLFLIGPILTLKKKKKMETSFTFPEL
jgi:hypothetical protein